MTTLPRLHLDDLRRQCPACAEAVEVVDGHAAEHLPGWGLTHPCRYSGRDTTQWPRVPAPS